MDNLKSLFPHGSLQFFNLNTPLSPTKPECDKKKPLGRPAARETESLGRTVLRYTGFFVRPQDPDNFLGSTKDCTDGLRRCGLVQGDEYWRIRLEYEQERVATFAEERIEVTIIYPEITTGPE